MRQGRNLHVPHHNQHKNDKNDDRDGALNVMRMRNVMRLSRHFGSASTPEFLFVHLSTRNLIAVALCWQSHISGFVFADSFLPRKALFRWIIAES